MNAWNIDANLIELNDIRSSELDEKMVITAAIKEFLKPGTKKRFIVAPKGFGKTYLLKVKSQFFRDNSKGYKFLPAKQLCERFTDLNIAFSGEDIIKFNDLETWKKTWKLCLYTLVLVAYRPEALSSTIREIVKDANTLCDILICFLSNRRRLDRLFDAEQISLSRKVQDLNDDSNVTQLAIFVDNIDEALGKHVGVNRTDISEKLWTNAQLALLLVSNDLCSRNTHIKFFLTIRSEAYNEYEGALKLQLDGLCVFLNYSKEQMKEIFIKNIESMDSSRLMYPNSNNPIEAFLGRTKIPHKFVTSENGTPTEEDIFDFIYRHTYKRPREIVKMGHDIDQDLDFESRKIDRNLAVKINEISTGLFEQLKTEIIPYFREDIFNAFCEKVKRNVIKYEDSLIISEQIKAEVDKNVNSFNYLYKLGLIGAVENEQYGKMKQQFLNVGEYTLTNLKTNAVQYYVIHPTLNKYLKHHISYYDKFNIIGYDLPFNLEKKMELEAHVHFGLDRESLILVLPELGNVKSFAVVVSPSDTWKELDNATVFIVNINEDAHEFRVISDKQNEEERQEILKGWFDKNYSILIYSDDKEIIKKCLKISRVISCCYLTESIKKILVDSLAIIPFSNGTYFYLCFKEYDERKYNDFKDYIFEINQGIMISPVLLDRYQYAKKTILGSDNTIFEYNAITEQYGQIICFAKENAVLKPSHVIRRVRTQAEFNFYKNRQNLLVESLYQLYRLLHHDGHIDDSDLEHLIDEFSNVQIKRIISHISEDDLHEIFPSKTRNELEEDLKKFTKESILRINELANNNALTIINKNWHITSNKEKKIFPQDEELYTFIKNGSRFYSKKSQNVLMNLYKVLDAQSLQDKKSWFISYSTADKEYAEIIHSRLILMGCKATIYSREIVNGAISGFELTNIKGNDRMIFVASRNSLKSDPCHRELKECFSIMRKNNDSSKLVIVSLDNYIFEIDPEKDIWDDQRKQNLIFIRDRVNVIDFRDYFEGDNLRNLHETLREVVKNS